jgi:hypothetical protein
LTSKEQEKNSDKELNKLERRERIQILENKSNYELNSMRNGIIKGRYSNVERKTLETTVEKVCDASEVQGIEGQKDVTEGPINGEKDQIAHQDLQDKHSSLNEATNLDVEKISSVSNAHQVRSKEDEMSADSKDKEASASEMPDKVIENDLEENLNQDNEVPMDTRKCIVKSVAEADEQMNVIKFTEEFGLPTKERTFNQIIRKPIKTKSTQVIELQNVEDYWKVRLPPKQKKGVEDSRTVIYTEDSEKLTY